MAEGRTLRNRALALQHYKQHLVITRVALREDRGAAQKLGLNTPRQTTQAGWLLQAQQFYANALADAAILRALTTYNLTQAELASGQAQVAAVASITVMRQTTQSNAQAATRARDAALQDLNRWMLDFMAVARVVLADHPQWLEQIGLAGR